MLAALIDWSRPQSDRTAALYSAMVQPKSGRDIRFKARTKNGWTPLHSAAARNHNPAVLAALVIKATDKDGWTPLHIAAGLNHNPAVIVALLDAGADLKATDEGGVTPLHSAAAYNHNPAVLAALLDAGADLKARTKNGQTPWDSAQRNTTLLVATERRALLSPRRKNGAARREVIA